MESELEGRRIVNRSSALCGTEMGEGTVGVLKSFMVSKLYRSTVISTKHISCEEIMFTRCANAPFNSVCLFLAGSSHQPGQRDKHLHHPQGVSGTDVNLWLTSAFVRAFASALSWHFAFSPRRPTSKAWTKTLSPPPSRPSAAVPPTLGR